MYIPKRYGQSKIDPCPFCGRTATVKNNQDVPVCDKHKNTPIPDLKCSCNSYLDLRNGKFGAYFHCMNCGNINMRKALALNPDIGKNQTKSQEGTIGKEETKEKILDNQETENMPMEKRGSYYPASKQKQDRKEITITSDDVNYI